MFNKTEEPFGGMVEWFKALVLKTIFFKKYEFINLLCLIDITLILQVRKLE